MSSTSPSNSPPSSTTPSSSPSSSASSPSGFSPDNSPAFTVSYPDTSSYPKTSVTSSATHHKPAATSSDERPAFVTYADFETPCDSPYYAPLPIVRYPDVSASSISV